jgi:hypothetical protein
MFSILFLSVSSWLLRAVGKFFCWKLVDLIKPIYCNAVIIHHSRTAFSLTKILFTLTAYPISQQSATICASKRWHSLCESSKTVIQPIAIYLAFRQPQNHELEPVEFSRSLLYSPEKSTRLCYFSTPKIGWPMQWHSPKWIDQWSCWGIWRYAVFQEKSIGNTGKLNLWSAWPDKAIIEGGIDQPSPWEIDHLFVEHWSMITLG